MIGIIGKKLGMTQIFNEQGQQIPCTVIEAEPNPVVAVTTTDAGGVAPRAARLRRAAASRASTTKGEQDAARPSRAHAPRSATRRRPGSRRAPRVLRSFRLDEQPGKEAGDPDVQGRRHRDGRHLRARRDGEGHRHVEGSRLPGRREALRHRRRSEHARQHEAPSSRLHRTRHRSVARHQGQEDARPLRRRAAHRRSTSASRRSTPSAT